MALTILLLLSVGFGLLHYHLALKKGLNGQLWLIVGVLFGPFSLPVLLVMKRRRIQKKDMPDSASGEV